MAKNDSTKNMEAVENIFAGGGEMGARLRKMDLTKTPLGPPETWSQALRTSVSICLNSRFPMVIWWGRELVLLYNDGWRPILGTNKDKIALGNRGRVVWAEVWDVLGPMFGQVLDSGEATWSEDSLLLVNRYDFTEEAYFTWSYSPIRDDDGRIGGVFTAVTETTKRVVGERRLQTLRDLGEYTAETKTADEACAVAVKTLSENPKDLPFVMIYLIDREGKTAKLCETSGVKKKKQASPKEIEIGSDADVWHFQKIRRTGKSKVIDDIEAKFGKMPGGAWNDSPTKAIVLPLSKAVSSEGLSGFMVAGLSPNLEFDADYKSFLELAAGHLATAIANARALEAEKERAEKLAELDRAKTEFFSNISHEFRTPLTLMLGNLEEVLLADGEVPLEQKEQIETAHRNSLRLLKLVNNLLDFSRIEAGKAKAHFDPTNLAEFTKELASNFRAGIEKAGMKLKVKCPPLRQAVSVDREMWEKIVVNLLSNAYKFTFKGEIEIALTEKPVTVELKVRDTGVGIPAHELPKIFERFHRVRLTEGRTHESTGIGLSLVQELVKLHGGEIFVKSEIGKGTVFTISIPKEKSGVEEKGRNGEKAFDGGESYMLDAEFETQVSSPHLLVSPPPLLPFYASAKILLADDNADMRAYISRLLNQNGYEVRAVTDGQAAFDILLNEIDSPPDLILSDVMMPRLNGFELLQKLRADEKLKTIPFIMLSARAGEESKVEGFDAGADDYLVKPFAARELMARIESNLKMARLRREAFDRVRESEERYRTLFNAMDEGFCIIEVLFDDAERAVDYRFLTVNKSFEKQTGIVDAVGKRMREIAPLHEQHWFETFGRIALTGEALRFENRAEQFGRWYEVYAFRTGSAEARQVAVFFRDISNRKLSEEKIRLAIEQFTIAEQAADGFLYDWHLPTETVTRSRNFTKVLGYADGEIENNSKAWSELQHPEDAARTAAEAKAGISENTNEYVSEYRVRHKDGHYVHLLDQSKIFRSETGEIERVVGISLDISKRKHTEEKLLETQARLNLALDISQIGIFDIDLTTGAVEVDEIGRDIYKWSADQPLTLDFVSQNHFHPDDRDEVIRVLTATFAPKGNDQFVVEQRIIRTDGEIRWIRVNGRAFFLGEGESRHAIRCIGTYFDITEQKRAEEVLREQQRLTENIIEAAPSLTYIYDIKSSSNVFISPQISELLGYTSEEISAMGANVLENLIHPDDVPKVAGRFAQILAATDNTQTFEIEYRMRRKDGAWVWLLSRDRIFRRDAEGKVARILGVATDLTKRKLVEEQLAEQRRLYKSVTDNATTALFIMDERQQCVFMNPAAEELTGYTLAETFGRALHDIVHHTRPDGSPYPLAECPIDQAFPTSNQMQGEEIFVHKNGSFYDVAFTASPLSNEAGETSGTVIEVRDITTRKKAEEKLREAEIRFRSTFEQAAVGIAHVAPDGTWLLVNQRLCEILGFTENELLAGTFQDITHPEDLENDLDFVQQILDGKIDTYSMNKRYLCKDGSIIWVNLTVSSVRGANRRAKYFIWVVEDITENKRAERNTEFLLELNQILARLSDEAEIMQRAGAKIGEYFEAAHCHINEFDLTADTAQVLYDWHKEDDGVDFNGMGVVKVSDFVTEDFQKLLLAGEPLVIEDTETHPLTAPLIETQRLVKQAAILSAPYLSVGDLKFSIAITSYTPRLWQPDEITLLRDCAARVWTSIERARAESALNRSEAEFRQLANSVPQIVFVSDELGKITFVNEKWTEFSGLNTEETATPEKVSETIHPDDRERIFGEWARAFATGSDYEVEGRMRDQKTSEYCWFLMRSVPIKNSAGEIVKWFGTSTDITANKAAEQERERLLESEQIARREAEQANRLKDEFLATVSHELRTPLNAILGWSTIARKDESDTETVSRALEVIERSGRNQNQIISDILDVSRIITGKLNLNLKPLKLSEIVKAAIDTVRPSLEAKRIQLKTFIETDVEKSFLGDADRLQQIVWNLLANAAKFTPEEGTIEIALKYENGYAEISVSDNGIGIEPEFLPFVFDRFRQADGKKNRKHGGLGLGLAVVRHLTELHGGSVAVNSEGLEKGAVFKIHLPLKTQKAESNGSENQSAETVLHTADGEAKQPFGVLENVKILVVDDEPDALELVRFILKNEGAQVLKAASVDDALEIFEVQSFDIVITDIGMPEKDGFDLLRELKTRFNRPIPAVALTAYAGEADSRQIHEAGFTAYLSKPFDSAKLIQTIIGLTSYKQ